MSRLRVAVLADVHGNSWALEAVLAGQAVTRAETKAFGCTIKRL